MSQSPNLKPSTNHVAFEITTWYFRSRSPISTHTPKSGSASCTYKSHFHTVGRELDFLRRNTYLRSNRKHARESHTAHHRAPDRSLDPYDSIHIRWRDVPSPAACRTAVFTDSVGMIVWLLGLVLALQGLVGLWMSDGPDREGGECCGLAAVQ